MKILFYRGKGFWAALIRWFTRSKYAHVAIAFNDGVVYEAKAGRGVVKGQLVSNAGITPFIFRIEEHVNVRAVRSFCEKQLGAGYDYLSIVAFLIGLKPRCARTRYNCAEFVADACEVGAGPLLERVDSFKLSPDNLSWSPRLTIDYATQFQWQHPIR